MPLPVLNCSVLSVSLKPSKPRGLRDCRSFQSCTEFRQGTIVVFVSMIRAELVAEFVQDEAIRVLGHAIVEPLPTEHADVVVEERKAQNVAGATDEKAALA